MEKSRIEIEKENWSRFVIKTKIKYKINLIYNSKLKSNDTWRNIGRKTRNLTQSWARNDPIQGFWFRRIQGFSFCDFENKFQHSRGDLFQFSPPILDFKHSTDVEMSLEEVKNKRF